MEQLSRWLRTAFGTLLQLLGLAGLFDSVVQWRDFIEKGILGPYYTVKQMLLFWMPELLAGWPVDYLVVGLSVLFAKRMQFAEERAFYAKRWANAQTVADQDRLGLSSPGHRMRNYAEALLLWPLHIVLMVPVVWQHLVISDETYATTRGIRPGNLVRSKAGLHFARWLFGVWIVFLAALFLLSDALAKLFGVT